jgi:hypothetical protein
MRLAGDIVADIGVASDCCGCKCVHLAWDVTVASDMADGCRCDVAGQRSLFVIR